MTSAFARQVGFPLNADKEKLESEEMEKLSNTEEMQKEGNVVCAWPDPLECPVLSDEGWDVSYEEIIAGTEEVLKNWSLKRDNESIEIDLYVSSNGNQVAKNRFLSLGSLTSSATNPYRKGPSLKGLEGIKTRFSERRRIDI